MNKNDLFWLAGLWEGEGTIAVYRHSRDREDSKNRLTVYVGISNNDPNIMEAVDRLVRRMGVIMQLSENNHNPEKHGKTYILQTRKFQDIYTILQNIVPYMKGNKRAIGILTMRFIESRLRRLKINRNEPPTELDNRIYLYIKSLNKRGVDKVKMGTSETICKALKSDDIVRTV